MKQIGRVAAALVGATAAVSVAGCSASRVEGRSTPEGPGPAKVGHPRPSATGDDGSRASAHLASLMIRHPEDGFRVLSVGSAGVGVARGQFKFMLQPRIQGVGKVNVIVVEQLYAVRPEAAADGDGLRELCLDLNASMSFIRCSIMHTPRGPLLVARSELAFGDSIRLKDLGRYLDELKHATLALGAHRMADYLK